MIGYTPEAVRDVVRHQTRLRHFSKKSAEAFDLRLALAEVRIVRRPKTYRVLHDGETRRYSFRINRTTYLIDYRLDAAHIVVLRVWHGHQDRPE
jgi:plasmid stabilization system protein ParE